MVLLFIGMFLTTQLDLRIPGGMSADWLVRIVEC